VRQGFTRLLVYYFVFGAVGIALGIKLVVVKNPKSTIRKVKLDRNGTSVWLRTFTSDVETYYQVFVKEEYSYLPAEPPRFLIDAGANIGLTSVYFSRKFPSARIIAIEPESTNVEMLKKNVQFLQNIEVVQAALVGVTGVADVFDAENGHWGFRAFSGGSIQQKQDLKIIDHVEGITVEDVCQRFGIGVVDLLKLDIEGAEQEVMSNSENWIGQVQVIAAELHDVYRRGCSLAFYAATSDFEFEWYQGELVFVARSRHGVIE